MLRPVEAGIHETESTATEMHPSGAKVGRSAGPGTRVAGNPFGMSVQVATRVVSQGTESTAPEVHPSSARVIRPACLGANSVEKQFGMSAQLVSGPVGLESESTALEVPPGRHHYHEDITEDGSMVAMPVAEKALMQQHHQHIELGATHC